MDRSAMAVANVAYGLLAAAFIGGWLIGDAKAINGEFNWTLALLTGGPLLVAGVVAWCCARVVDALRR